MGTDMFALVLMLSLTAAPPDVRMSYEKKCLYCHSEEVSESKKLTELQWKKVIEQMRRKSPLLIARADVPPLMKYIIGTLKLGLPPRKRAVVATLKNEPDYEEPARPAPVVTVEPVAGPTVSDPLPSPEEVANAEQGFALMQKRCSKCHTLSRVYRKLDSFERSMAVVERMRMKTGSAITDHELAILETYLRNQFE